MGRAGLFLTKPKLATEVLIRVATLLEFARYTTTSRLRTTHPGPRTHPMGPRPPGGYWVGKPDPTQAWVPDGFLATHT